MEFELELKVGGRAEIRASRFGCGSKRKNKDLGSKVGKNRSGALACALDGLGKTTKASLILERFYRDRKPGTSILSLT